MSEEGTLRKDIKTGKYFFLAEGGKWPFVEGVAPYVIAHHELAVARS
jgi:hypothetical protein